MDEDAINGSWNSCCADSFSLQYNILSLQYSRVKILPWSMGWKCSVSTTAEHKHGRKILRLVSSPVRSFYFSKKTPVSTLPYTIFKKARQGCTEQNKFSHYSLWAISAPINTFWSALHIIKCKKGSPLAPPPHLPQLLPLLGGVTWEPHWERGTTNHYITAYILFWAS